MTSYIIVQSIFLFKTEFDLESIFEHSVLVEKYLKK
jgi:hypothetical protein